MGTPNRAQIGLVFAIAIGAGVFRGALVRAGGASSDAPAIVATNGYLGASGCFGCHEEAYKSWHASFHRSMTARPDGESLLFLDPSSRSEVDGRGKSRGVTTFSKTLPDGAHLEFDGNSLVASVADASTEAKLKAHGTRSERVPFVTGRHRYQVYWLPERDQEGRKTGQFTPFPWVFLADEKRFVPRSAAFVSDPKEPPTKVYWSSNCIQCHTTNFAPREHDGRFDPEVTDLGIACEACHGPSAEHAAKYRSPIARWLARTEEKKRFPRQPEAPQRPRTMDPVASAQLCGRCHALTLPKNEDAWFTDGYRGSLLGGHVEPVGAEVAGDPLDKARILLTPSTKVGSINVGIDHFFDAAGRLRVTGREYQALAASPCFSGAKERDPENGSARPNEVRGTDEPKFNGSDEPKLNGAGRDNPFANAEPGMFPPIAHAYGRSLNGPAAARPMTCTDCHSMHAPESADQQLRRDLFAGNPSSDGACLQCHKTSYATQNHVQHAPESAGARCVSCHMPRRVYGLLGVRRSHEIESDPSASIAGTPSACTLCHLQGIGISDDPFQGRSRYLSARDAVFPFPAKATQLGDAADRVLLAGLLGFPEVRAAVHDPNYEKPLFQALANDPYVAVRIVTARSLARRTDLALPVRDPLMEPAHDWVVRDPAPITLSE